MIEKAPHRLFVLVRGFLTVRHEGFEPPTF